MSEYPTNFENLPTELKNNIQWVTWILENISVGKTTKRPYIAGLPKYPTNRAKVDDPTTWKDYPTALLDISNQKCNGIGYVFSKDDPYCFIDLDHCVDKNGIIEPESQRIIDILNSYTEISQSGLGIHIIVKAERPEGAGNRKGNFEIYTQGRYCAMTGNILYGNPGIMERQEQVSQICSEIFKKTEPEQKPSRQEPSTITLSDQEIIEKASKAKNSDKFNRLMSGQWQAEYPSQSEADLALCYMLAFWTPDTDQIDRLFRQSGLYRDKWDRADYRNDTINKALENTTEHYKPGGNHGSNKSNKAGNPVTEETKAEPMASGDQESKANSKSNDPSRYFVETTFIPSILAEELRSEYDFICVDGILYIYLNGVYKAIGDDYVESESYKRLKHKARANRVSEIPKYIKGMCRTDSEKLNTYKFLINLNNGMYDIKTEKLLPHSKDYLSTIRIPVNYDPSVSYSVISDWLESTLCDPECIQLACELFGYSLIPDTTMAKAFMLVGSGANGKSTFLTVLENFIGKDNVSKVPLQELSDHRFKRAELFGKLINLFADLDNRALESTTYFKTIVTGDTIDAERKNQNPFFFKPFSRLVFSANEIPRSRDRSFAYYRRWCIIPFERQFIGADDKKGLADELSKPENLSALLNCALSELKNVMKRQSFSEPKKVKEALNEYEKQNDPVKAFVDECCKLDPSVRIERGSLYDSFCIYCNETGFKAVTRNIFYQRLRIFKEIREIRDSEKRMFEGIKLNAD